MSNKEYLIHINSIRIDNKNNINTIRLTTTKRILNIDLHFRRLQTRTEYQTCVYDKSIKDICKELNISLKLYNDDFIKEKDYKYYVEV